MMKAQRITNQSSGWLTSPETQQTTKLANRFMSRAIHCLDLSQAPAALKKNWGYEGAIFLKEILDRIDLPPLTDIPDALTIAEVEKQTAQPFLRWRVPNTAIDIVKIAEGDRQGEYLFAAKVIPYLDGMVNQVKPLPYKTTRLVSPGFLEYYDRTPGQMVEPRWLQWLPDWSTTPYLYQALWKWIVMVVLLVLTVTLWAGLAFRWHRKIGVYSVRKRYWGWFTIFLLAAFSLQGILLFLIKQVGITGPLLLFLNLTLPTAFWFLLAVSGAFFCVAVGRTIVASPRIDSRGIHASLITATSGLIGFTAALVIIFHGLSNLGISPIPLLTGLGVGSLAIALAARPTLENIIGGFMILTDRPYRIGQRVLIKGYEGEVEKIGLRSTRIRLLRGHQTIIPNEEMARVDIENISRRPYIRRKAEIGITYNTPPEKIERAVELIKEILKDHDGMHPELPPKVYFSNFNADSLNITIRYWYHTSDIWAFRAFNQQVNMRIIKAFAREQIEFAFPTVTTYLTQEENDPLQINLGTHGKTSLE